MVIQFFIVSLALVGLPAWAEVRFPTDGELTTALTADDIAGQISVPIDIVLNPSGKVGTPRVYLQDIGKCSGPLYICTAILAVDMGESAQPGRTKIIGSDLVKSILHNEFPDYALTFSGAPTTRVESQYMDIGSKEVEGALQAVLESRLKENPSLRLRTLHVQMPRPLHAWPGEYRLRFPVVQRAQTHHIDALIEQLLGDRTWEFIYEPLHQAANRSSVHRLTVTLDIELQLPVARSHIARGSILQHGDFEYKWIRVGRRTTGVATEIKDIVGLLTKQALRSGEPVQFRNLDVPEVVARGAKVKMIINKSGLVVAGEGKALKGGGVGQSIAVFYPATKKTVQGKILADGTVEVKF